MDVPQSTRQLKVAREIQRDLAEIIRSRGMAAYDGAMVTVSGVKISSDLAQARYEYLYQTRLLDFYRGRELTL